MVANTNTNNVNSLNITLNIVHGKTIFTESFTEQEWTLQDLYNRIEAKTQIPTAYQKIIVNKRILKTSNNEERNTTSFEQAGIHNNDKIALLTTSPTKISQLQQEEKDRSSRLEVLATRKTVKPIKTFDSVATIEQEKFAFHQISSHSESDAWPLKEDRQKMLEALSKDPAILHLMKQKQYSVFELNDDLHPIAQPTILGLNKNAGQSISLRLLTDDLDSLIWYRSVRRVLLHELAHNVHSDHDNSFKALDSEHVKIVSAYEVAQTKGNRLGGEIQVPIHEPETERALENGGSCTVIEQPSSSSSSSLASTGNSLSRTISKSKSTSDTTFEQDLRREEILKATEARLNMKKNSK